VRFCLACSERTGELVERSCPALERRRQAKADARAAKDKRRRAAARREHAARTERNAARRSAAAAARLEAAGDLQVELERLWPIARALSSRDDRDALPEFAQRRRGDRYVSGHAYYEGRGRIVVSVGDDADVASAYGVLAHEVAHLMVPDTEHHGPAFWMYLVALVREAYGAAPDLSGQPQAHGKQLIIEQSIRDARQKDGR